MKRQLLSSSPVDEPQRNVRSRGPFAPSMPPQFREFVQHARHRAVSLEPPRGFQAGVQSVAPSHHADHQSYTSVPGESISGSSDAPHSLQQFAGSTAPRVFGQHESLISSLDGRGIPSSSEVPPPASDPLVPSMPPNLRSHIPALEERSVSLPSTSSVDEPQRNVRSYRPFPLSMPPHFHALIQPAGQRAVSFEPPRGFQPGVQYVAPSHHADHQSPTSVPGGSISGSSDAPHSLQPFAGSTARRVFVQHRSLISGPDERGISFSLEVPPHASDPLVPSTAPHLRSHIPALWSLPRPVFRFRRVILSSVAPPAGSHSLARLTAQHLSEQHQNRTFQCPYSSAPILRQDLVGPTSNHSQHQNPQNMPAYRHRDMRMDIDRVSYEELLALGERIGKVETGIKTSELSKFVKEVICCGDQDEAEQCVICLEQYEDADVKGQLKCTHEYHLYCIGKWMEEQAVSHLQTERAAQFEQ